MGWRDAHTEEQDQGLDLVKGQSAQEAAVAEVAERCRREDRSWDLRCDWAEMAADDAEEDGLELGQAGASAAVEGHGKDWERHGESLGTATCRDALIQDLAEEGQQGLRGLVRLSEGEAVLHIP